MSNTTTVSGSNINIVLDGSTDWVWSTALNAGLTAAGAIKVNRIQVIGSAANDRVIIHDGGIDSAPILDTGPMAGATTPSVMYFDPPVWMKPVIDASDCTFDTVANVRINIGIS